MNFVFKSFTKQVQLKTTLDLLPKCLFAEKTFSANKHYKFLFFGKMLRIGDSQHFFVPKKCIHFPFSRDAALFYYVFIRLSGLGFRAWKLQNQKLVLELGFSHYFSFDMKKFDINCFVKKDKIFLFSGNSQVLNQFSKFLNSLKPINVYSLKGVRVIGKKIVKKVRKKDRMR